MDPKTEKDLFPKDLWRAADQEDPQKKERLDWLHPQEAGHQYYQASSDLIHRRRDRGEDQEHMAHRLRRGRNV